eukprot:4582920-Pleurochrysis_carterae.AAC.1
MPGAYLPPGARCASCREKPDPANNVGVGAEGCQIAATLRAVSLAHPTRSRPLLPTHPSKGQKGRIEYASALSPC